MGWGKGQMRECPVELLYQPMSASPCQPSDQSDEESLHQYHLLYSATMKIQEKERWRLRLSVSEHFPYVEMGVLFTTVRMSLLESTFRR